MIEEKGTVVAVVRDPMELMHIQASRSTLALRWVYITISHHLFDIIFKGSILESVPKPLLLFCLTSHLKNQVFSVSGPNNFLPSTYYRMKTI